MSATQIAAQLFQLQQIDLELERLSAEQQAAQEVLHSNSRLRKLHSEYDSAQQQLQAGRQAQKEAEWTLEDLTNRLRSHEQRLYSGMVENAKELQSIQQEVQRLRAQQSRQEDITLEMIETAEALEEITQRRATALKEAKEAWEKECSSLLARRDLLVARHHEVQTQRAQLVVSMQADLLSRYEKMRKTKQGRAISKVEQNSCQWCRVILTPSELQHVRISPELQTCTNCGRILYYDR